MSTEDAKPQPDPKIAALRSAGHDEAADLLVDMAWHEARAAAEKAAKDPGEVKRPAIPLVSDDLTQRQVEAEGRIVGDQLMRSRVGQSWVSGGSLLDDRREDR